jgi:segregation and condensation protein A
MVDHTNEETTVDGEEIPAPVSSGGESSAENGGPETWNLDSLPPELDYFRSSEAYQVELTGFQGPMDLLLHLIDREQVDIYDIPIARITDQFIKHIEVIKTISLDEAGEFIAMAATLMVIKMKMLMPSHGDEEEGDEEDPRAELVRKLLEYRRFKEAAESLQKQETERRSYHLRQTRFPFTGDLDLQPKLRIEMFDLLSALAGIFDRMQSRHIHDVVREAFTVEEKMSLIEEKVGSGGTVRFEDLFSGDSIRMEVIVTFIAILEMVKRGRLNFMQTEPGAPIWIQHPGVDEQVGDEVDLITLDEDHATEEMPEGSPNEWENKS